MNHKTSLDPISIKLDDGQEMLISPFFVEDGYTEVSRTKRKLEHVKKALQSSIATTAKAIKESVQDVSPDEASIELSFGFAIKSSELIAVLVNSSAEGAIKVTLTWKNG